MRILFLNPAGLIGGAERALLDVIASLRAAYPDWQLSLIAAADGDLVSAAHALGSHVSVLAFPRSLAVLGDSGLGGAALALGLAGRLSVAAPAIALYRRRLRDAISATMPDLVHTNGFKMHLLGSWAASRQVPVLWHIHDFVSRRPLMSRLLRRSSRRCAAIVANSRSVADDIRMVLRTRPPIFTVYNAIDLAKFAPAGALLDLDARAGMPPLMAGGVRVGIVATMARWKGHEIFLRALAMLPASTPVRGYVIGGPRYETAGSQYTVAELRALAVKLGVAERVGFTGFVGDVASAMRALDVVVHASTEPEPFGLVIAEAMACGRAVIASAAGGAAEIIEDGADALAHSPGDAPALAQLIVRLASDSALRERLGQTAALTSARRFAQPRLAADLSPIYRAIAPHA
ncbi:MAG TPA: glycosyltransferase, partial [Candidatus Binataceae bacterium]|nr:glycosyltransferase [Candidatus Binataceae bacterium]